MKTKKVIPYSGLSARLSATLAISLGVFCTGVIFAGDGDKSAAYVPQSSKSVSPTSSKFWSGEPDPIDQGWFVPADSPFQNLYLGVGYGPAFTDLSDAYDDGSVSNEDKDDDGMTVSTFIGYRFSEYIGLEAGFAHSDDISYEADSDGSGESWAAGDVSGKYEADIWSLYAVGSYPATPRLTLFARLGILHWETKETFNENGFISTDEDSGETLGVGGGFEYDIGKKDRIKIRGDLGYYSNDDDEVDVVDASVAFVYEFP